MPAAASVQKQQGLNQVVINKVQRMIESRQGGVMDTINRLLSEGRIAQDFIAPIGVSQRSKERPVISFKAEGRVQMAMPEGNFNLHGNAISQISEKMGIPAKYLRELSAGDVWQKQLCATILNEHSGWTERTRVLIRAVGMEVRGVLSDSYRRLNSVDILTAFIREAGGQGAVVSDAYMNDTKVWCETILPTPIEIPTRKNGTVIIFAGARFSTSDYGNGSVEMRSFLLNGACLNGMVRESVMRQIHLWRPTAGIPVPLPKDLRTGHADHRIGCFRPDQRTVQQRHHHAEGHRNSRSIGNRRGFRQGTEESGAERSLVEK